MKNGKGHGRLFDRTLNKLSRAWRDIAATSRPAESRGGGGGDEAEWRERMAACLEGRRGAVTARASAAALGHEYLGLDEVARKRFLGVLGREFDIDQPAVDAAVRGLQNAKDVQSRYQAERALRAALTPPRIKLLMQFNALPEGVKFLVDMRADLLAFARDDPALLGLQADLRDLLISWFDVGFLELRNIGWDEPASLLEKLIAYEAVHEIRGWSDLRNRLDLDRRCFAFFHPCMPGEPLIFVEVALVKGLASSVQTLLNQDAPVLDPEDANTAVFYSISNAQKGLAGIRLGEFLIKRVVQVLMDEVPTIKTFATLSPIPGFLAWLRARVAAGEPSLLRAADRKALASLCGDNASEADILRLLDTPNWQEAAACRSPLMRLCAYYLMREKRRGHRARDPVADFHLSNGARLERLHWLADISPNGMASSAGMMITYRYKMSEIEKNVEMYHGQGQIAAAAAIRSLVDD